MLFNNSIHQSGSKKTVRTLVRLLYLFAMDPELTIKEALTLQELTDHGFTRREIPILTDKLEISLS